MFTRRHPQASPSVTLEQGIARLRPARPKAPSKVREDGQYGTPYPSDAERRAAAILASIAFATLLAVCLALYLLSRSSRWELSPLQSLLGSEPASSSTAHAELLDPYLTPLPEPRRSGKSYVPTLNLELRHSSEKYLSYLPHSGFHNQRIALENALVLAYILNRTLLIPPVRLGEPPLRYRPSKSLRVDVALSSHKGLEHCALAGDVIPVPQECIDFQTHTQLPWNSLVDLVPVTRQHGISILPRLDITDAFLTRLGISPADTFFLHDTAPYQFRFFDRTEDYALIGQRYTTRVDLPELAERAHAHRLLHFGTLFGTTRLRLADPVHVAMRRDVRKAMVFANSDLLARADAVRDSKALGGEWGYVAVHLRLGDGVFADKDAPFWNARHVWWRLVRELGVSDEDAEEMESLAKRGDGPRTGVVLGPPPPQFRDPVASRVPHPPPPPLPPPALQPACQDALHPRLHLPLYIATDAPGHPALGLFMRTFPCVYFLANFSQFFDTVLASTTTSTTILDASSPQRPETLPLPTPPDRILGPFLDALIASKARVVIGTPGSTFSRFVEDVLWRRYHGWEIVERG